MSLRVGCVAYINALPLSLPFRLQALENPPEFTYAIPSTLNQLLKENHIDCALTSSLTYLEGEYQLLPGFGIVGTPNLLSVNLYTKLPLTALNGARIGLTHHSATSSALLKVLCQHHWKIAPRFELLKRDEPFSHYDAFLLIGDEALENQTVKGFQTLDLAAAWYEMTALPFVFALFALRNEICLKQTLPFQKQLESALQWSQANRPIIEQEAQKLCKTSPSVISQHYSALSYLLGTKEFESLEIFKTLK